MQQLVRMATCASTYVGEGGWERHGEGRICRHTMWFKCGKQWGVQQCTEDKQEKKTKAAWCYDWKEKKRKTLPCVLWSDTLQLFWSAPLLLLCGPPTWIYSALCFLPCHPEKHATFCKVLTLKQKWEADWVKYRGINPVRGVLHVHWTVRLPTPALRISGVCFEFWHLILTWITFYSLI